MNVNTYLMLVETEDNSGLFEVFDTIVLAKGTPTDIIWSQNAKPGSYLLDCTGMNSITLNSYFDGNSFILDPNGKTYDLSDVENGTKVVAMMYEDKVFSLFLVAPLSIKYTKYDMALDSKTICLLNDSDSFVNLGYIWNGEQFLNPEGN